ncbi:MAG: hypothetical protein J2P36_03500 [Ktedonobacteraceae bacterium]|nr:hypothetical protein [Ktedonobacteraceae bacterium]
MANSNEQQWISSVNIQHVGDDTEIITWDDGSTSIEQWGDEVQVINLTPELRAALRDRLNGPDNAA